MLASEITRIVFGFERKFQKFVEIAEMSILDFIVFTVHCKKGNMIRESIY